jgi:hypothetical protein
MINLVCPGSIAADQITSRSISRTSEASTGRPFRIAAHKLGLHLVCVKVPSRLADNGMEADILCPRAGRHRVVPVTRLRVIWHACSTTWARGAVERATITGRTRLVGTAYSPSSVCNDCTFLINSSKTASRNFGVGRSAAGWRQHKNAAPFLTVRGTTLFKSGYPVSWGGS